MTEIVGWDKDSTLADTTQRRWMAEDIKAGKGSSTWEDYSRACKEDKPVESARTLMRLLAPYYQNVIMTGANDCPEARDWLKEHRFPYSRLFFRKSEDYTANGLLKVKWIKQLQAAGHTFHLYIEDWVETAEFIEAETGVPCLVLNPRYKDIDGAWGSLGAV